MATVKNNPVYKRALAIAPEQDREKIERAVESYVESLVTGVIGPTARAVSKSRERSDSDGDS